MISVETIWDPDFESTVKVDDEVTISLLFVTFLLPSDLIRILCTSLAGALSRTCVVKSWKDFSLDVFGILDEDAGIGFGEDTLVIFGGLCLPAEVDS